METNLSQQDNFNLINKMIATAKGNLQKRAGKHFILWGYLVLISSVAHYLLELFSQPIPYGYGVIWIGIVIIGITISLIMGYKDSKKKKIKTYTDTIVRNIWMGFIVSLIIIMVTNQGMWEIYPAITLVYTLALFISAVAYKFKWMYIPVILSLILLFAYQFIDTTHYPLIMAAIMIIGNIIPGHYINHKAKKQQDV